MTEAAGELKARHFPTSTVATLLVTVLWPQTDDAMAFEKHTCSSYAILGAISVDLQKHATVMSKVIGCEAVCCWSED